MDEVKNVIDTRNVSYKVERQIGEGGQGRTFLLEGGKKIAKLFFKRGDSCSTKSTINYLRQLGLDTRYFGVPQFEINSPSNGYIAEFATGMMPLTDLKWRNQEESFLEWYKSTGGTEKRYRILANLAHHLRMVHSRGLTYCDLSPSNVFVSSNPDESAVFLIDMDNVRHKTSSVGVIFTPFYGAPEIVAMKSGNTPMSDCFSFAVIAYELLTMSHPLIGDYVNEGDPDLEQQALEGKLPWTGNEQDRTNECSTGISPECFVTKDLMTLFRRTFEEGLNDPDCRPDIYEWYEVLCQGKNDMLFCPECGITYPYSNRHSCTNCGRVPSTVKHIRMRRWGENFSVDNNGMTMSGNSGGCVEDRVWDDIVIDENTSKYINTAHFLTGLGDTPENLLKIRLVGQDANGDARVEMIPENGKTFRLFRRSGQPYRNATFSQRVVARIVSDVDPQQKMMIALDELGNTPQRVLTID